MMISRQSYSVSGIITSYFFFFVSFVLHTLASPMPHYCHHDQRDALLEFKHEFPVNESNPLLSSWNKSSDCCSWDGVTCDAKSREVISLYLNSVPLNNSLKPNSGIFKLQHLRSLTLTSCGLYGEIPVSFANFTKLSYLGISDNQFTGEFPLVLLNLTTSLSFLDISYNLFKSTLPPDMSRFHNLEDFDVSGNSFFGPFPSSLFMIPSLTSVILAGNQFNGPIEFRNTSSSSKLQMLYLVQNKFDGPLPISITKFPNLLELFLSDNNISGPIPPRSVSKLHYFRDIDLSNNKLEGQIPGWLRSVRRLKLSHNSFSSFEKSFQVFKVPLEWDPDIGWTLDLSSNSFQGPLPHWICKIRPSILPTDPPLLSLDLSNNNFSGSIPRCLTYSIAALGTLNLQNNNLSKILPDVFVNATDLMAFDISGNQLEGKLPKSLINCTSLKLLNVGSNRFTDKFPSWLASLPRLNVLILRSNEFYGPLYHPHESIEFQSLRIIDISHNHFNGTLLPFYFSNSPEMTTVTDELSDELDENNYDYNYMGYLGYTDSMEMVNKGVDTKFERIRQDFRAIDFSGNKFCGEIPKSIGLLKELRLLNMSGNSFTSNIPQSLANLTKLEALDLSRNQLSGQIPRNLGTLFSLAIMNFSHNNLQGPIPRGTQFLSQNCSSFMGNPRLYGLEDVCGETHVPSPTPQESEDLSEPEEQVISWIAAAIAYGPGVFCGLVIGRIFSSHKHKWFM